MFLNAIDTLLPLYKKVPVEGFKVLLVGAVPVDLKTSFAFSSTTVIVTPPFTAPIALKYNI